MKRSFALLLGFCLFTAGIAAGVAIAKNLFIINRDFVAPGKVLSAEPPLNIPNLQTITADAPTSEAAFQAVVDYYGKHVAQLETEFKETNPQRLKALFAMYTVHVSHLYGTLSDVPSDFLEYLKQPYSNCGPYSYYQAQILDRFGVSWRIIGISGGTHQFVEANIDGRWETFEATVNDWMDKSAFEMERGAQRRVREFYSPMLEVDVSAYQSEDLMYGAQELRTMMPGLGVFFFPKAYLYVISESSSQVAMLP